MISRFVAFLFLLSPSIALGSDPVTVRSGEHADFTRFVMRINEGSNWTVNVSDTQVSIEIDQPGIILDTSTVFSRIPKSRVLSVFQAEPGAPLEMNMNCDCSVEGFIQNRVWLVIDVKGKPSVKNTLGDEIRDILPLPLGTSSVRYRFNYEGYARDFQEEESASESQLINDNLKYEKVQIPITLPSRATIHRKSSSQAPQIGQQMEFDQAEQVSILENRIISELERADSQGLLESIGSSVIKETSKAEDSDRLQSSRPAEVLSSQESASNHLVSTAIDRDLEHSTFPISSEAESTLGCEPNDDLNFEDWANSKSFGGRIGDLRLGLFDELGNVDPLTALSLVKTYLFFGFGAEARQILNLLPEQKGRRDILIGLSYLLDGEFNQRVSIFYGLEECANDYALWGILAAPGKTKNADHDAVLQAVSRLPDHLRDHIGSQVAQQYAETGDSAKAAAILRVVARSSDYSSPGVKLARGETEELMGNRKAAQQYRLEAIYSDTEHSPSALIALIESSYSQGGTVPPEIVDLAASYATEYRNGAIGPDLQSALALALALTGDFGSTFEAMDSAFPRPRNETGRTLENNILKILVERGSDVDFLRYAIRASEDDGKAIRDDIAESLAERLLQLGFSDPAVRLLSRTTQDSLTVQHRLLRAKAALARALPHEAMASLLGLEGVEADSLRGRALLQLSRFDQAAEYLLASNSPEEAARSLWIAGAWDNLPEQIPSFYRDLAETAAGLRAPTSNATELPPLTRAQTLVADSAQTRNEVMRLLENAVVEP